MSFPDTAVGVLVLALALLPGLPGDYVYRTFVGVSWRESELRRSVRLLAFSVLGLIAYAIFAQWLDWVPARHVIPSTFTDPAFSAGDLSFLGLFYLGHVVGAAAAGATGAGVIWLLARISPASAERDAWDELIHSTVNKRWVVVSLAGGDSYLGFVAHADVATAPEFRDLILREPYRWDANAATYAPTRQQHLFLRGSDVASIATVYDSALDGPQRVGPVDQSPFSQIADDRPRNIEGPPAEPATPTAPGVEGGSSAGAPERTA